MPNVLVESTLDPITEQVELAMTQAEEEEARRRFAPTGTPPDLSDGGRVHGVQVTPMSAGKKLLKGRPAARRSWMWNGTESLLPLAWNPDGTQHDGARHYLRKRFCLCCHTGGFYGAQCPNCAAHNCEICKGSTVVGKVIPCFYLRKEDVPFPSRFYGNIDCFLPSCPRRGARGFLTEEDMRLHARSRHRMEYQVHVEMLAARKGDEVAELRRRVDELMGRGGYPQIPQAEKVAQRMTKARAAKRKITKPAMA